MGPEWTEPEALTGVRLRSTHVPVLPRALRSRQSIASRRAVSAVELCRRGEDRLGHVPDPPGSRPDCQPSRRVNAQGLPRLAVCGGDGSRLSRPRDNPVHGPDRSSTVGGESVPVCPGAAGEPGCHHRWRTRGLLLVHHIDRDDRSLRDGVGGGASPPGARRLDAGLDGPGVLRETRSDAARGCRAAWVGDGRRHVRLSTGSDRPTRRCDAPGSAAPTSAP
jgi:hypothetical protein